MKVKDQLNRTFELRTTPKRIISLVPSLSELLVDLSLGDSLVGVTKFCVHPKSLVIEKTVVGGTKKVKLGVIASLHPDIIIANKEENTIGMIDELKNVAPVYVSDIHDLGSCYDLITAFGKIFEKEQQANVLIDAITTERSNFIEYIQKMPRLTVAYVIWKEPWMVVASETFIDAMLRINNFDNIYADKKRYPSIDINDLVGKNLDLLLLPSEPFPFGKKEKRQFEKLLPETKIQLVDGEMFSWYGSRLKLVFKYFREFRESVT